MAHRLILNVHTYIHSYIHTFIDSYIYIYIYLNTHIYIYIVILAQTYLQKNATVKFLRGSSCKTMVF